MLDHRLLETHPFALIDPLVGKSDEWGDLETQSLAPPGFETCAHLLPYLTDLSMTSPERQLQALDTLINHQKTGQRPLFTALITSNDALPALRARLRHRLLVRPKPGALEILRFHDPRVFRHLIWYFGAKRLLGWLGVAGWAWFDDGEWHAANNDSNNRRPLAATQDDWAFIHRIETINTVMRTMRQHGVLLNAAEHGKAIDTLVTRAQVHGLKSDDLVTFAAHGLQIHEQFDSHPEVQNILAQCAQAGRYRRRTGSWGDARWTRIKKDLAEHAKSLPAGVTQPEGVSCPLCPTCR